MKEEQTQSVPVLGIVAAMFVAMILVFPMLPGLFFLTLLGGTDGDMPEATLALCQENFIFPLEGVDYTAITSFYGPRNTGIPGASTDHKGIDIGAVTGTHILAVDGGTVTISSYRADYGNYVEVDHGNGVKTRYGHMSKRLVAVGEAVAQGDIIGLVGSTGVSSGPHLHFEVWYNGVRFNPLQTIV